MNIGIITSVRPYFLDNFPGATLAVSLRRLNRNYSGNCIRVRRSSDNTEQDIGFANGVLNQSSLTSFVGAGNGFVTTWYDQSGNGNNVIQPSAASQPKIVTSGSVITQSGLPCINTATNLSLRTSGALFNGGTFNFIAAIGSHPSSNAGFFGNRPLGNLGWFYDWRTTNTYQMTMVGNSSAAYTSVAVSKHLAFLSKVGTSLSMWFNSIAGSTNTSSYGSSSISFYIGVDGVGGTNYFTNGNIYEVIGYTSSQLTNRTAMQTNVNSYYSIY